MADYRLSEAAKRDLIEIARYGDERYGIERSDQYRDLLKQKFSFIANHPFAYQAVEHIHPGYRRSVMESHSIYYRIGDDGVEIMRIIGQQNPDDI